ncbi:MAG: Uma2 family endonuclease [Chloroflexaceae bacterium]|nr:Uma2 family endonuclease [Chloroflexaceae bacterium]
MDKPRQIDTTAHLEELIQQKAIKLEVTDGIRTWRLLPSLRHQKLIDRIRATIQPVSGLAGCGCYHISDASLRFPDGSLKRPDIAIFCVEPPDIDESWEQVPEAVIEIVSADYEEKDLSINPPWYIAQGVKDVLIVEPRSKYVKHFCHGQAPRELGLPLSLVLRCGCQVTI